MALMHSFVNNIIIGADNYAVELYGKDCKLWKGEGLPIYEGSIDGLEIQFPAVIEYLLAHKYIKLE